MKIQWALVIFTVFASLSAGLFASIAVLAWYGKGAKIQLPGILSTIVALGIGGGISALHLGHPERIFGGFSNLHSGITRELIAFVIVGLIMLAYLLAIYRTSRASKPLCALSVLGAAGMVIVFADSYLMPARPVWDTVMLPLTYLASAAVLGLLTLYLIAGKLGEEAKTTAAIGKAIVVSLFVQAAVLIGYMVRIATAPFPDPSRSLTRLLIGDISPVFWLLVVVIGLGIPYYLLTKKTGEKQNVVRIATAGLACAVIGGTAFRALIYVMGTTVFRF